MPDFPSSGNFSYTDQQESAWMWLDELNLSARTYNALFNNGISSITQLISISDSDLLGLSGLGAVGYQEIRDKLESLPAETLQRLIDAADSDDSKDVSGLLDQNGTSNIQVDESYVNVPIEHLNLPQRSLNALSVNGVTILGDLAKFSFSDLRESFVGIGNVAIGEIEDMLSNLAFTEHVEFHEFLISNINAHHLEIFDSFYGLSSSSGKKTLEEVGQEYGVTRERIRQIIKSVLLKVTKAIQTRVIKPDIELKIFDNINCPVKELPELSSVYNNQAVLRVYVDTRIFDIQLYNNVWLDSEWIVDSDFNIDSQVGKAVEALKSQIGPVSINELAAGYSLHEKILYDISKTTISDGVIVLNTNKRATGNDLAFEIKNYMDKAVRPVTVEEVRSALNLTPNQARGLIYRIPGVVNVGLSTYALTKYGYTNKSIVDIAAEFLAEEGEPTHIDRIISFVTKYRLVKKTSIPTQLNVATDVFTRLDDGYYALKEWGYEPTELINSRLEVSAKDAVLDILSNSDDPMTPSDVLKAVISKYGERSTNKAVTISSVLVSLYKEGKLIKLGTDYSPFYALKKDQEI